jgi:hypothetical protein
MQMELISNSHVPDGLLAAMTLLSEKPHQGVPSWESALHPGIDERNCTAVLGLRFGWSGIVSGTVVAPNNGINMENGTYTLHVNVSTTALPAAVPFCTTYPTVCAGATTALEDLLAPFAVLSPLIMLQGDNSPTAAKCEQIKQAAIQSCSAQFIGRNDPEAPVKTRACVRKILNNAGCFNY